MRRRRRVYRIYNIARECERRLRQRARDARQRPSVMVHVHRQGAIHEIHCTIRIQPASEGT